MGATALSTDGKPPLTIEGGPLSAITWELPVPSAQVKTAVLLAGLRARGRTTVRESSLSRDHTERLLPAFGVALEREGLSVTVHGGERLHGVVLDAPSDVSSAAFLVVAALLLPDSEVRIDGVGLNPGRTAFLDVLRSMGARIDVGLERSDPEPIGWISASTSRLRGVAIPPETVPALIDEVPALAVAATQAEGELRLSGASELRVKESDRIAALAEGLTALGADVEERPDGLVIRGPKPLRGARVRAHDDHRIAMAMAVAGLVASGETEIEGGECVSVSFPEFPDVLARAVDA
jgi:3-phosphoshikimate 1-carboxyvinyltransferase